MNTDIVAVVQSGEETAWEDPTAAQCLQEGHQSGGYGRWGMVGEQRLKQKSQAGMRGTRAMEQVAPQACAGSIHESVENQVLSSLVWSQS